MLLRTSGSNMLSAWGVGIHDHQALWRAFSDPRNGRGDSCMPTDHTMHRSSHHAKDTSSCPYCRHCWRACLLWRMHGEEADLRVVEEKGWDREWGRLR